MAWQKRYDFCSLLGVTFIISVDTGEILDLEVKCKHCFNVEFMVNGTKIVTSIKAGKVNENESSINH